MGDVIFLDIERASDTTGHADLRFSPCAALRKFFMSREGKMGWKKRIPALAAAMLLAGPAGAAMTTTVSETFDGTLAEVTWRLGTLDEIVSDGGNPGSYLRNRQLDAAVPTPVYVGPLPSAFFGNYRAANVTSLGFDVNVFAASIGVDAKRPISLVLGSDMGTPDDPSDDCEVYFVGSKPVPRPGSSWRAFDFRVPSGEIALPKGWTVRGSCAGLGPDAAWNAVIQDVDRVSFPFADPDTLWYFQIWDLGIDNVRIATRPGS
jgi:hypothetical protein